MDNGFAVAYVIYSYDGAINYRAKWTGAGLNQGQVGYASTEAVVNYEDLKVGEPPIIGRLVFESTPQMQ